MRHNDATLEVEGYPEQDLEHTLLRGVGLRHYDDGITTMALYFGTLKKVLS